MRIGLINLQDKMYKCEYCGKEVLLPFAYVCCFCRKAFCYEHRLPENHRCPYLPYVTELKERLKSGIPKSRKIVPPILAFCIILIVLTAVIAFASYQFGYKMELRDPTYQETLQFIRSDLTDENEYKEGVYTCTNFATDFRNNALKTGYRCGYVLVFSPDWNHALNCFNTTDYGLIFVEPQDDEIITLTIGQPYWDRTKYASPSYNDTVTSFLITW